MNEFETSLRALQTIAHPKAVESEENPKEPVAAGKRPMVVTLIDPGDIDRTHQLALIPSVEACVTPTPQAIASTVFSHARLVQQHDHEHRLTFHVPLTRARYQVLLIAKNSEFLQPHTTANVPSSMPSSVSNSVEVVENMIRRYFEQPELDTALWKYITVV